MCFLRLRFFDCCFICATAEENIGKLIQWCSNLEAGKANLEVALAQEIRPVLQLIIDQLGKAEKEIAAQACNGY
jgi:hypothetical protein